MMPIPVLFYACELLTTTKKQESKMHVPKMAFLRITKINS